MGAKFFNNYDILVLLFLLYCVSQTTSDGPWFTKINLQFFNFTKVQKWYVFSRNRTQNFEFWFFFRASDMMLGSSSTAQLPVSHEITRVNNQYTYERKQTIPLEAFCSHTTILFLSVQYSINYVRYRVQL